MRAVRVGVLDSGIAVGAAGAVEAMRRFCTSESGGIGRGRDAAKSSGHGTRVAEIIAGLCPHAYLLDAQVFDSEAPSSAALVAAGLDWLVDAGAVVVNMSFGLRADREVLRKACGRAVDKGTILVAATPASGGGVFPAAYPGVVRVTGDARCSAGEYSYLGTGRVDFGACNGGLDHTPHTPGGGASFAVPHVVAWLASYLSAGGESDQAAASLRKACRYEGREHRSR